MDEARVLAKWLFESRMFSAYGTPQSVLSTVLLGRELGLPAMAALRSVHIIEGKHSLSAELMVALVLKSRGLPSISRSSRRPTKSAPTRRKRKGAAETAAPQLHNRAGRDGRTSRVKPKPGKEARPLADECRIKCSAPAASPSWRASNTPISWRDSTRRRNCRTPRGTAHDNQKITLGVLARKIRADAVRSVGRRHHAYSV